MPAWGKMLIKLQRRATRGSVETQLRKLDKALLWGIPQKNADRDDGEEQRVNNALLLFWHEYGTQTEPARPSVVPGIRNIRGQARQILSAAIKAELNGKNGEIPAAMHKVGALGVEEITGLIRSFIPPPITDTTKRWRLMKKKAYQNASPTSRSIMMKQWMSSADFTPLIDTEQMINAITYEIRYKKYR